MINIDPNPALCYNPSGVWIIQDFYNDIEINSTIIILKQKFEGATLK